MNTITGHDKIAMCKACTLAECMKQCKLCSFNIGLSAEGMRMTENRTNELKKEIKGTLRED